MRAIATLDVERAASFLRYRLELPGERLVEALQQEFRQPADEATLRALRESAVGLLRSAERPGFAGEAERRGTVLYGTLVPPSLRGPLKAVRAPLLISTSLYGLPWELLHDGEEFWGIRYAMGKRLVTSRAPAVAPGGSVVRGRLRALVIGSDPLGDLPFVRHEVDTLCEALEQFADIACVTGPMATFDTVTAALGEGFDLIHYCGHVRTSPDGPALVLADEVPLAAAVIEASLAGRPLVVLNGCASARGAVSGPGDGWEEGLSSVANGFLFGGALAVIGTLCDVSDRHAAELAHELYRRVRTGLPVGEALRAAREHCRRDPTHADSPSWLAFVLYGNPALALLPVEPVSEPATSTPAPHPVSPRAARTEPATIGTQRRSARYVWAGLALVALVLGGLLGFRLAARLPAIAQRPGPLVIGVMEVRPQSAEVPDWMREITRDSLSTILGKLDGIRVYSRQKIDFLREKRSLSEIEAAEALGMSKMLSGTLAVDGPHLTLGVQVVDIESGLLQGSDSVQGSPDRLIELQNELALRTLRVLGVTPPDDKMREILASRTNDNLENYRMLTESLGDPDPGSHPPASSSPGSSWLQWGTVAWASDAGADEAAIREVLARWVTALQGEDIEAVEALQAQMTDQQRAALLRYFENAKQLEVHIYDLEIVVEGDEALATFVRDDRFTDSRSGRSVRLEMRINGVFVRDQGAWKIRGLRSPS